MRRVSPFACALLLFCTAAAVGQEPIRFGRTPDISPDGRIIAFSYLGDIWTVESVGGVARAVTRHEAHDISPVFSPDGRQIAFSSNRHGSYDVFVIPAYGGKPRRLTYDSANDLVCGWTPDGKNVLFTSRRSPSFPAVADLYVVPAQGGRETRVSAFEGRDGAFSPDGSLIAYVRGSGTWYRKGYRGSSNDDLWICRADGTQNRRLTGFNGQDGSPMWSADGKTIYYVSEQFGLANICRIPAEGGTAQPVTRHADDGVRRARISANGEWIVYECGADIYVCSTNGEPNCRKVAIDAAADDQTNPEATVTVNQNISEYALAPNEQFVAFTVRGKVFLMPVGGGKARQLTDDGGHDHDLAWSPDLKKLLFVSDRNGEEDLYVLEQNDPEHPELVRAHQFKITQLTKGSTPVSAPGFSPDGKYISFLRDGKLWVANPDGSNARTLVDQLRVIEYDWSPDGRWIVYSRMDGQFASELYIIPAAGGEAKNVTRYATRNFGTSWSADGKKLAFISQRRQDLDVFVLSTQKPVREGDTPRGNDIDFDEIHQRVERATSLSSDESEAAIKPDGTMVAFRSNALNNDDLWIATTNGSQITRVTTGNQRPTQIRWSKGGTIYFLDGNGALRFVRPGFSGFGPALAGGADPGPGRVSFTAKLKIERNQEFHQMFDESWRKLRHSFYDPQYHGANWESVRAKYRPLVKHVALQPDAGRAERLAPGHRRPRAAARRADRRPRHPL
jgi:tricorn protease